jgi:ribosomal protein S18 acetylase RimI-like enzyme
MSVEFRPMRDEELPEWLPRLREGYAADMVQNAGATPEAARAKAEADTERLFPDGLPNDEQFVFVIESDGQRAGEVWFAVRDGDFGPVVWVFSVEIDETMRGRGLGRAAMQFVEDEARKRGVPRVALNVMGGNEVARGLYRSLGYAEVAVAMGKDV